MHFTLQIRVFPKTHKLLKYQTANLLNLVLGIAVNTAVNLVFLVNKLKCVYDFLFYGSNAAWVLAFNHIFERLRKLKMKLSVKLSVFYNILQ